MYDIETMGSRMVGTIHVAILARQGAKVLEAPKDVKDDLHPGHPAQNITRFMKRVDETLVSPRLQAIRDFLGTDGGPQMRAA